MSVNQLQLFIIFLINGFIIGILFDSFRILRKTFKHKDYIIYIHDILFWIITAFLILYTTAIFNDGQLRLYMIIGVILGFGVYLYTLSKYFININVNIILFIKKLIKKTMKILLIPIKYIMTRIKKIIFKPITFLVINIKKLSKKYKFDKNKKIKEGF